MFVRGFNIESENQQRPAIDSSLASPGLARQGIWERIYFPRQRMA